jgi:hypothetical protein
MKTLLINFNSPTGGDLLIVEYSSPRGGCTSVKHRVLGKRTNPIFDGDGFVKKTEDLPAQSQRDIATTMSGLINKEWMHEAFQAGVVDKTGALKIHCTGLVEDVKFKGIVEGKGSSTIDILEI